jgi:hypothetical protein
MSKGRPSNNQTIILSHRYRLGDLPMVTRLTILHDTYEEMLR